MAVGQVGYRVLLRVGASLVFALDADAVRNWRVMLWGED